MPDQETAYLSARVPTPLKNRFKSLAARRGLKVQELLNQLVADYVAEEDRQAPIATDVVRRLRRHQTAMAEKGLGHLYLFGSVAKGDARPDSDIDLAYELRPGAKLSLFEIGRIEGLIREALETDTKIDLVPRASLRDHVTETASLDEILVF
ncbi:DNA polymerase III subunit beta [Labrenzia sp. C1B10]|uniref:nucleotidyltransferase domain-containing protein n=1 Tax=unclassified Labrenzia TaxID=2648686 RepID=UPI0003B920C9|nr:MULTISPECIES: nucleotidyltransferase domain-containing protein [unclassified Labrenzia]ERP93209.1 DNA polymerase III subunit beta [Labrenzia sp. C1B10]ERS02545.1 DNA polymerase III subunit beta [Labrenzia sp. C1B70]